MASWPPRCKDKTRCREICEFGGDEPAVLTNELRACAAADVSSLLAFRPWHDARGPRRGARRRQPGVPGQAQLCRRLALAGRWRRGRRNLPRCAATRIGGGGTD